MVECDPHLVVCGGTLDAAWKALGEPKWGRFNTGMEYFKDPKSPILYIEMPHPSARYPVKMVHSFLAASTPEILRMVSRKGAQA